MHYIYTLETNVPETLSIVSSIKTTSLSINSPISTIDIATDKGPKLNTFHLRYMNIKDTITS